MQKGFKITVISYDKTEIRDSLTIDNIFELLDEWGGNPELTQFGIISTTICHNLPGEGSRKLYYYENSGLFKCYTDCDSSFDIFELTIKVAKIQSNKTYDLNDAVCWVAYRFGFSPSYENNAEDLTLLDWKIFGDYAKIQEIVNKDYSVKLKTYDQGILNCFNYNVLISPWIKEGITREVIKKSRIGFYPGEDQITIPHYDKDGNFIGLRGRTICAKDAEKFGKYRPLKINKILYSHPLGMNLYNLNNSKNNIAIIQKAIVFESEKSALMYQSYFGAENDISVACCGSNITIYQIQMLIEAGAKEIVIAFDRQFQELGDDECKKLTTKFKKFNEKYKNYVKLSFIFDKNKITSYKASPIDEGPDKFLKLFKERVVL